MNGEVISVTYLCLYQALNIKENTGTRSECVFHYVTSERYCILTTKINLKVIIKTVFFVVLPFLFSCKRFKPIKQNTMFKLQTLCPPS